MVCSNRACAMGWWLVLLLVAAPSSGLLAQPNGVSTNQNFITVQTGELLVRFRSGDGSVQSVIHKATGVDLLSRKAGAWDSLWTLVTRSASGNTLRIQLPQAKSFEPRISEDRRSVDLIWRGIVLPGGRTLESARVTARVATRENSPNIYWNFGYSGLDATTVTAIQYPSFFGVGELGNSGEDDYLLYPSYGGIVFRNPVKNLKTWWYTYPSGYASLQFLAFFDANSGFYFATEDDAGAVKDMVWSPGNPKAGDRNISFIHQLDGTEGGSYELPYSTVLAATQGDWYAPAALYKRWAVAQKWVAESKANGTPTWISNLGSMFTFYAHAKPNSGWEANDRSYDDFIAAIRENQATLDTPSVGVLLGWEKDGGWAYGDYFPPQEGWKGFDTMIAGARSAGSRVFTFIGPHFLTTSSKLYKTGQFASSEVLDENFQPKKPMNLEPGIEWAWMDTASAPWREKVIKDVETLAQHGSSVVQLDGFPACDPQGCSNTAHGHPPLIGGTWTTRSWIDLLTELHKRLDVRYPELVLAGETGAEPYIPYVPLYHASSLDMERSRSELQKYSAAPVPLYQFVYHPYQLFIGGTAGNLYKIDDGSYLRLCLSRALLWGEIFEYQFGGKLHFDDPSADRSAIDYLKRAVKARTGFAEKYLVGGDMLPQLSLDSNHFTVSFHHWRDGSLWSGEFPSIGHSVWMAKDGTVGILLTNISPKRSRVRGNLDFNRIGLDPAGRHRLVLTDGASRREISSSAGTGFAINMMIDPGEIQLLEID